MLQVTNVLVNTPGTAFYKKAFAPLKKSGSLGVNLLREHSTGHTSHTLCVAFV